MFNKEKAKIPTAIGKLVVVITTSPPDEAISYEVHVLNGHGMVMAVRNGNLVPHLTQNQIDALRDFMDMLRTKAYNEIIGEE